jgi:hypothetical protein
VAELLAGLGARPWQVEQVGPLLVAAVLEADVAAAAEPPPDDTGDTGDTPEDPAV